MGTVVAEGSQSQASRGRRPPWHDVTQLARDTHAHLVHFYEADHELARVVAGYLRDGLASGAALIVIATEAHRRAFAAESRRMGFDLEAAEHGGRLEMLDAAETLERLRPSGRFDRFVFQQVIGRVIRAAAASGRPVVAYGEMVALLWEAGEVPAAIELEMLWNELAGETPFSLLCAYRSASTAAPEQAPLVGHVCALHTGELNVAARSFRARPEAPAAARRFLSDTLRTWGYGIADIQEALLVLSELATNAVVHARTGFVVRVQSDGVRLRLEVEDGSLGQPRERARPPDAPSGRGVHIVACVAEDWGVNNAPDGKSVWAELASCA